MRKFLTRTVLFLALFMALPFLGFAADREDDEGTVQIVIVDRFGQPTNGDWFLRRGGKNGLIVRNGISDDEFFVTEGSYFLEIRITDKQQAYELDGDALQFVAADDTYTYNIRYYPDEEAMALGPMTPLSAEEAQPEEEAEEETEEEAEPEETEETVIERRSSGSYVPTFEEAPRPFVPSFETAPATSIAEAAAESEPIIAVPQLARTGFPAMLLILPSVLGGLLITGRRKF